jgi:predicted metal-dependent peptidase
VHKVIAASDELAESTINEVIEAAKIRGWGNMSGNGTEELKELLKPARIPWKQLLRRAISPLIYDYGPYFENTWSRRNRRSLPLPGMRRLSNRLIVSIDTSGSIGHSELQQFFTEIEKIVKDFSQLIIIQWDTAIQAVEEKYKRGDWRKIKIKGRGGTDVQCVFDYLMEHKLERYPIVNFSDGYFSMDYDTRGVQNVIWCITSEVVPKGGKTIHCEIQK